MQKFRVSHLKERKEKNCLNCNTTVEGRYCQVCGQENVQPRENFWNLTTHFVYDIMHFDGKFFSTLKYLLLKPGFLTKEYIKGKRATYLHPIRMYVFASAIFFLIFFSFISKPSTTPSHQKVDETISLTIEKLRDSLNKTSDPEKKAEVLKAINSLNAIYTIDDSLFSKEEDTVNSTDEKLPLTLKAYDSIQKTLPDSAKDNYFERMLNRKRIDKNNSDFFDGEEFKMEFKERLLHSIPQMLFISLPLLALLMQLLYIRRRKELYYVDHLIFLIHIYIAFFICLLIYYGFDALYEYSDFKLFDWITGLITLYLTLYMFLAMKNFYGEGYFKTIIKFLLFIFLGFFIIIILFLIFIFISFLQV